MPTVTHVTPRSHSVAHCEKIPAARSTRVVVLAAASVSEPEVALFFCRNDENDVACARSAPERSWVCRQKKRRIWQFTREEKGGKKDGWLPRFAERPWTNLFGRPLPVPQFRPTTVLVPHGISHDRYLPWRGLRGIFFFSFVNCGIHIAASNCKINRNDATDEYIIGDRDVENILLASTRSKWTILKLVCISNWQLYSVDLLHDCVTRVRLMWRFTLDSLMPSRLSSSLWHTYPLCDKSRFSQKFGQLRNVVEKCGI